MVKRSVRLPPSLQFPGGHPPNPPDPALALAHILDSLQTPAAKRAAALSLAKLQSTTAQAQAEFWTGVQKNLESGG